MCNNKLSIDCYQLYFMFKSAMLENNKSLALNENIGVKCIDLTICSLCCAYIYIYVFINFFNIYIVSNYQLNELKLLMTRA